MLGFSDGTKDGGYFMANWSIYIAKERLSQLASEYGIQVAFFLDGRGGPQHAAVEILTSFTHQWVTVYKVMTFN